MTTVTHQSFFGQAAILDRDKDEYIITMMSTTHRAQSALGPMQTLQSGDTVLVAGNDPNQLYIIGLIQGGSGKQALVLEDGTRAVYSDTDKSLNVVSGQGELLFEYDARRKTSRVNIREGDLEINNPHGRIDFHAKGGIRLASRDEVEIRAHGRIFFIAEKLETLVDTVLEKAKNVYRFAEKLTQIKTGRMRTIVEGTSHLKTKKAFYKAEKDFKIKGDKIHLG